MDRLAAPPLAKGIIIFFCQIKIDGDHAVCSASRRQGWEGWVESSEPRACPKWTGGTVTIISWGDSCFDNIQKKPFCLVYVSKLSTAFGTVNVFVNLQRAKRWPKNHFWLVRVDFKMVECNLGAFFGFSVWVQEEVLFSGAHDEWIMDALLNNQIL